MGVYDLIPFIITPISEKSDTSHYASGCSFTVGTYYIILFSKANMPF